MNHKKQIVELERQDLNKSWHILFTEPINHPQGAEHLGVEIGTMVVVIHHRIKGFLIALADDLAEIRNNPMPAHRAGFSGCMNLWPDRFAPYEEVKAWLEEPSECWAVSPDMPWVEMDGHDPQGYPSIMVALNLI